MNQVYLSDIGSEEVLQIVGRIRSSDGESKSRQERIYRAARKPKDVNVWPRELCDGLLCIFDDVMCYHNTMLQLRTDHQHFSCVWTTIFLNLQKSFSRIFILGEIKYRVTLAACVHLLTYLGLELGTQ